jgi:hypothetical protein
MVVLIGGPARAGKGLLSRKLATDLGWPLLSLDVLKMALSRVVPDLGIDPEAPSAKVGEAMWPLVRAMAENAVETGAHYVFEGDMLYPRQLAELRSMYPGHVTACFLGYSHASAAQKLAAIRKATGLPNDWLNEHDDGFILDLVQDGIAESQHLSLEAEQYGFEYFDGSVAFEAMLEDAFTYLRSCSATA